MKLALLLGAVSLIVSGAETHYYLIEGVMKLPTGRTVGSSVSIVKRTVDRAAGGIEETVLSLRGQEQAKEFTTVITLREGKASITSPQGGLSGEATLSGPDWAWTGMKFTSKLEAGGMRVEGEDEFSAEAVSAHKSVFSADGQLQIKIDESGRSISKSVYDILRSRLLGK